ncbi:alpha/beta-hydrolase [Fistulina hepatica ATCC 64428]|uniref:Alpha/beta-hydrolase n=1 Tax=Fistulina hepatica ATCC 64428 TaxID=1128425 RepID=A0A0D7AAG4_9AGAR|nr:alpha/beta-hydrolase [Fistulina hepatica ATCC 64428]
MPPPPEISVYESYMKSEKLESEMEETGEGGHVFWFGKKDARNVLFYIHGGGFVLPLGNFYPSFLGYLYKQLDIRGVDFSIAMLSYSVYPDAPFPLVLKQTISALNSLINAGLSPQRIHLCGDSSGGNVILQLLSHILHPLEDVPSIALQTQPFGSIILMSPWVSMTADSPSHFRETGRDFLGRKVLKEWGAVTLDYIASFGDAGKHLTPYLEGAKAPDDWYSGVQALAPYVLITAGEYELLLDDIESFLKMFRTRHGEVTYFLEEGAMHVSPLADGFFNETNRTTPTTQKIIDWLEARCKATEQTK